MPDEVVIERDVMSAMRDGIKLACDIYRPARNGQVASGAFPVILERTLESVDLLAWFAPFLPVSR